MKIAFVANTCWNIYNFRRGLVHHFLNKGNEVVVLAPKDEYSDRLLEWGVKWIDTPLEGTGANPVKDLSYLLKLISCLKAEKPDVLLTYTIKANIYACLAGKLKGVPVICNVSGLGTVFLVKGISGKIAKTLYRLAFRFSSHIFFQNEDDEKLFTSIISIDKNKTGILPGSGIDLEEFKVAPLSNSQANSFVMISRVIIEKGVREFAEAASHFATDESVRFTLIGKFDKTHSRSISKEELDYWIGANWIEYLDHSDDIKKVISNHEAVILPSYREGTSRTLLEGAALGRPLIATDVPGCREIVKDGYNGFLCEVQNAKSLRDKLKLFLSLNSNEKEQLAANSRTLVAENYDERIVIDIYENAIRRIIH
ncbi:glycosyltransferase family 4 protein [Ekhidna sp. To15]|uniref:glycosyltransferase family 4 protein n=1 Tax=Ekhidna sp. To15 TaxID=3395267 RepID=UPI003F5226B1